MWRAKSNRDAQGLFRKVGQPFDFQNAAMSLIAGETRLVVTNMGQQGMSANNFFLPSGISVSGNTPLSQWVDVILAGTCAISGVPRDVHLHHNMSLLWVPNAATPTPLKNDPTRMTVNVTNDTATAVILSFSLWGWILPDDLLPAVVPWL